jgi:Protein of unknown function (DUF4232)
MRSLITGVLLTCVSLLAAACSGSSGSSASSSPATQASPAQASPVQASPAQVSPAQASPAQASPALPVVSVAGAWSGYGPCPALAVRLGLSQAVGSVTYQVIVFTNRSGRTCFLDGVPGINLGGGTPVAPIGLPATQASSAKAARIAIQPGAAANALLQITDARSYSTAACGPVPARYLIVYLPNAAASARVPYRTTACSRAVQMMQVSAVSRGTGG